MKIRTKLLTAVLASATALSCALTASALDPTPSITLDNTAMPATLAADNTTTATLTLKSSDFKDVKGAKITITLPDTMELVAAKIVEADWIADTNYKVDTMKKTVTLVDVFNFDGEAKNLSLNLELTVKVATIDDNTITISGDFADENADKVYKLAEGTTGTLVIGKQLSAPADKDTATANINEIINGNEYFIPEGGVYKDNGDDTYSYATKNADGSFDLGDLSADIQVLKCKLPSNGKFTTFSSSKKNAINDSNLPEYEQSNGIQFGTYVTQKYEDKQAEYGTLVIMGDYNAFRNYCGEADSTLLPNIAARYDEAVKKSTEVNEGDPVSFRYGTGTAETKPYITVKRVKQTKLMWKGDEAFQYAVRLYKLVNSRSYTAVAYSASVVDGNTTYTFSNEIQTKVNPFTSAE